ncbi:MAG: hypothetical protein HYU66_05525 [Armatimonadetes bacterium]|nr:hypothetical protein [Armatimonadota bacterium]
MSTKRWCWTASTARSTRRRALRSTAQALYRSDDFRWNGYDPHADHQWQAETLRRLCVSTQRSLNMCEAALAHRLAMRLVMENAPSRAVLAQLDRAVEAAAANQRLYQLNYDDDYDWTDGLCARLTDQMKALRDRILIAGSGRAAIVKAWVFDTPGDLHGWTGTYDMTAPVVEGGALRVSATGSDPQVVLAEPLSVPVDKQCYVEIETSSDRPGKAELFWTDRRAGGEWPDRHDFRQHPPCGFTASGGERRAVYTLTPDWSGELTGLRLDPPDGARVRLHAIRIRRLPEGDPSAGLDLDRPLGAGAHAVAEPVLHIPWEPQTDIVPPRRKADRPGLYLSLGLGLNGNRDVSCLGVVYTVQLREGAGDWRTLLRRAVDGHSRAWEHWDVPVPASTANLELRFLTDSYSRAQDRNWPSWQWALWGRPQLVEVHNAGSRRVVYDFAESIGEARHFVRLDADGRDRPFDGSGEDGTGATFRRVEPSPVQTWLAGAGRGWQPVEGFVAALPGRATHEGGYRSYLGVAPSWWGYAYENGAVSWTTAPVPRRRETAVVFIGGTNYTPGTAELWCDGRRLLGFETGSREDAAWRENGVELRYYQGGDTRDERTPYGLSGVFLLRLPASQVQAGKQLSLTVKMLSGNDAWFMLHGYARAFQAAERVSLPTPNEPCIAAFTPHVGGAFGVTGADFGVDPSGQGG